MRWLTVLLTTALVTDAALAQETVPQAAESAASRAREEEAEAGAALAPEAQGHQPSYEVAPIYETVVVGARPLREEERIGEYEQPRWTATRRFPTTRVYVVPAGTFRAEYWNEVRLEVGEETPARLRTQYEVEIGLGKRLQLDIYLTTEQRGGQGDFALHREKVELRWALAKWGVIPGNPTLYAEVIREHGGPLALEGKVLLGGELAKRWHWGANLVFERAVTGLAHGHEYKLTGGVAYSLIDAELSLGAELSAATEDVRGDRFAFDAIELLAGPSIQWRPTPPMHVDVVALGGAGLERGDERDTTPILQVLTVVGWEL